MAHSYITESEFYRYAPDAASLLSSMRPIYGWIVHSGSVYKSFQAGAVSVLFQNGEDLGNPESSLVDVNANGEWFYEAATDTVYLQSATDPAIQEILAGEDHSAYVGAIIQSASRLIDALIDATHPTPVPRDNSGAYDEVIKQATAYKLGELLAEGREPALAQSYRERLTNADKTGIIDGINGGWIKLAGEIDADSSTGEIREMGTIAGGIHLTRTFGEWTGTGHDRLKIIISTAGAAGTAKFKVFGFDADSDTPKSKAWTDDGGEMLKLYQKCNIGMGLSLLFEGNDGDSAALNDEWELELFGRQLQADNSGLKSISTARY
ncbi:MAG: hypothetical protein IIA59_12105 [Candidatus Marinimicrobia bacterium]|nr:hypothetical protein [Candidatus Neomarinimicrobiota bacterium]